MKKNNKINFKVKPITADYNNNKILFKKKSIKTSNIIENKNQKSFNSSKFLDPIELSSEITSRVENKTILFLEKNFNDTIHLLEQEKIKTKELETEIKKLNIELSELRYHKELLGNQNHREREIKRMFEKNLFDIKTKNTSLEEELKIYIKEKIQLKNKINQLEEINKSSLNKNDLITKNDENLLNGEILNLKNCIANLKEDFEAERNSYELRETNLRNDYKILQEKAIFDNEKKFSKINDLIASNANFNEKLLESEILRKNYLEKIKKKDDLIKKMGKEIVDFKAVITKLGKENLDIRNAKNNNEKIIKGKLKDYSIEIKNKDKIIKELKIKIKNINLVKNKTNNTVINEEDIDFDNTNYVVPKPKLFG